MDSPVPPTLSPITPRLPPRSHTRTASRSPTRERFTDDILSDLSPSTTLEAFTNPSGKLRASVEAASESERAFGIRATLASKKIQEWVTELSAWSWPAEGGSSAFELPSAKRRKISDEGNETEYIGGLLVEAVLRYEVRVDEITEDMEDLKVEEIKRQVLDTHFSGNSRPSSSASSAPMPSLLSSYTKMEDFTAIVTATVLQTMPNLSRLRGLMDVWSIRLAVLRKVPPLLAALDDAEVALSSGWNAIHHTTEGHDTEDALSRETFDVMRGVLEDKVTSLGQDLDYMLDTFEGQQDTLPDAWIDRMEAIEHDYGEWVVAGDRKVREGEWATMAKSRKEAEEARKLKEAEEAEEARLMAEKEAEVARKSEEERAAEGIRRKAGEDAENERRLEAEQIAEEARRKTELDAAEAKRLEEEEAVETARQKAQQDADDASRRDAHQVTEQSGRNLEMEVEDARRSREEETEETSRRNVEQDAKKVEEEQALEADRQKAEQEADAAESARRQILEAARAQAAESEAQAERARRRAEQLRLEETAPGKERALDALPRISEKGDHADAKDASPRMTAPATAIVAAPVDLASQKGRSTPCCDLSPEIEKLALFDGGAESQTESLPPPPLNATSEGTVGDEIASPPTYQTVKPNKSELLNAGSNGKVPQPPLTPSPSGNNIAKSHPATLDTSFREQTIKTNQSPSTPKSVPRFGHTLANFIRRSSMSSTPVQEISRPNSESTKSSSAKDTSGSCTDPDHTPTKTKPVLPINPAETQHVHQSSRQKAVEKAAEVEDQITVAVPQATSIVESDTFLASTEDKNDELLDVESSRDFKRHSRDASQVSEYSLSDPTPEIQEAEPAAYFHPIISPIRSPRVTTKSAEPTTPTFSKPKQGKDMVFQEVFPTLNDQSTSVEDTQVDLSTSQSTVESVDKLDADIDEDNQEDSMLSTLSSQSDIDFSTPIVAQRASLMRINTGIKQISLSRPQSSSSETPTIVTGLGDEMGTPIVPPSPLGNELHSFAEVDEQSPSAGRIGLRNEKSRDISPPGSPPMRAMRGSSGQRPVSPTLSISDPSDVSTMSMDAPILDNVDVLEAPISSSPTRVSDNQLQQQISSILQSIPTRIRLTSEPDAHQTDTLRPKKTRRSITPSIRSHSSLSNYSSSRAPTPSFLLSPAYSQTKSRPRPSNGNPEIKLYHLSRSTGEAPIKLFVRLVGEHGERVMVRVGGGWADLGEYLKEYASHHGRRSVADNDKVEIQDLPARIASGSTIRGTINGRASPAPSSRPVSAMDRPISSLAVRKTRKSVGDASAEAMRSPSTPLPMPNRSLGSAIETPPSNGLAPRSSSRMSWAEDDSSLGLAGPKSKKVAISERDQEWVESMKEKVRQASAEKDRERERRERGASFGEMERVGGTKRLFRKGV